MYLPESIAFVDGTELQQQIPRPLDNKRKKIFYSLGKKKRHTIVKNQIMTNNYGIIIHKADHEKGRSSHD